MAPGARPADALLPPPQQTTPVRKSRRCGVRARPPYPHHVHPRERSNEFQLPAPRMGHWERENAQSKKKCIPMPKVKL